MISRQGSASECQALVATWGCDLHGLLVQVLGGFVHDQEYANAAWLISNKAALLGTGEAFVHADSAALTADAYNASLPKLDFALDLLANEGWATPKYIREGLEWLAAVAVATAAPEKTADERIADCLAEARSFVLDAGAGAGKTYSLVECLKKLCAPPSADRLRRDGQQIARIPYSICRHICHACDAARRTGRARSPVVR